MKKYPHLIKRFHNQRGVVIILVGIGIVLLLSLVALAIDVAYTWVTRNELQNISDAASLAAVSKLANQQETPPYTIDPDAIKTVAQTTANLNQAAGKFITLDLIADDVQIGRWHSDTKTFEYPPAEPDRVNAVCVKARRETDSPNGSITTFFAGIMGQPSKEVSTKAIAALTGPSVERQIVIPVGISEYWFPNRCGQPIKFYPTNDITGCAGWNTFGSWPSNARKLSDLLDNLANDPQTYSVKVTPEVTQFVPIGGQLAMSVFPEMEILFDTMKIRDASDDATFDIDLDTDPTTWKTWIPVYHYDSCENPNQKVIIAGFALVTISEVTTTSPRQIIGTVVCTLETSEGGGPDFGVHTIKLVQ
jgi:Flp pilus assembly protein TadG